MNDSKCDGYSGKSCCRKRLWYNDRDKKFENVSCNALWKRIEERKEKQKKEFFAHTHTYMECAIIIIMPIMHYMKWGHWRKCYLRSYVDEYSHGNSQPFNCMCFICYKDVSYYSLRQQIFIQVRLYQRVCCTRCKTFLQIRCKHDNLVLLTLSLC